MRAATIVAVFLMMSSCGSPAYVARYSPGDRRLVIAAQVGTGQPTYMNYDAMKQLVASRCPRGATFLEEGTTTTQQAVVGMYGGGTYQSGEYYWVFKCLEEESASPTGDHSDTRRP